MTKSQFLKAFEGVDYNAACNARHFLDDLIIDLGKRAAAQVSCRKSGTEYTLKHGDATYRTVKQGDSYDLYVARPDGSLGRRVFGRGTKNFWGVSHPSEFKLYIGTGILKK